MKTNTSPLAITYEDIVSAAQVLEGIANVTPVMTSRQLNQKLNAELFFKCENLQRGGAFKFRGAYNTLSRVNPEQQQRGVIAFSSGNHAQAVALASRLLNIKATIVMPQDAPKIKLNAVHEYGAEIILYHRKKENREEITRQVAEERGLAIIPPYNHPHIMAGQGTAAKELFSHTGHLDYLFVCVGGGGLIAGCATAAKHLSPNCHVIGVEPEAGNDAAQSLQMGKIVELHDVPVTIADGAQTASIGKLTFPVIQHCVRDIITVTDHALRAQMRFFVERMKMVVEPTGCLAAAGAMSGQLDIRGKRVGVIISGGNIDPEFLGQCMYS